MSRVGTSLHGAALIPGIVGGWIPGTRDTLRHAIPSHESQPQKSLQLQVYNDLRHLWTLRCQPQQRHGPQKPFHNGCPRGVAGRGQFSLARCLARPPSSDTWSNASPRWHLSRSADVASAWFARGVGEGYPNELFETSEKPRDIWVENSW